MVVILCVPFRKEEMKNQNDGDNKKGRASTAFHQQITPELTQQ